MLEKGNVRQELLLRPIFEQFAVGTHANSTALRAALLQCCYSSRNFVANPTMSSGTGTCADDDNRMQVDPLMKIGKSKGKHPNQK